MTKRLDLIFNGKGGVGKSFFAVNFVQYLKDKNVQFTACDCDNENSTLKRFHGDDVQFLDLSQLAFILPHKFFNAQYGEPLRGLLAVGKHLRHVIHFGDQQIFPGATNYVCLLFLAKSGANEMRFVRADNLKLWMISEQGVRANISATEISKSEWNFVIGKGADLFERLNAISKKLEDVTSRIFQGIKTSADKIYILEETGETKAGVKVFCRQNEREYILEKDLLHPLIKGGDSKAFRLSRTNRLILFPYAKQDGGDAHLIPATRIRTEFPLTWDFLNDHKEFLAGREDGKMDHDGWYADSTSGASVPSAGGESSSAFV
jgi:hypothetical protein